MRYQRFVLRRLMYLIAFLALILTIIIQNAQLRSVSTREQQLRAELAESKAQAEWVGALLQWQRMGDSPGKRWAEQFQKSIVPQTETRDSPQISNP
jgi:hypothetical protein